MTSLRIPHSHKRFMWTSFKALIIAELNPKCSMQFVRYQSLCVWYRATAFTILQTHTAEVSSDCCFDLKGTTSAILTLVRVFCSSRNNSLQTHEYANVLRPCTHCLRACTRLENRCAAPWGHAREVMYALFYLRPRTRCLRALCDIMYTLAYNMHAQWRENCCCMRRRYEDINLHCALNAKRDMRMLAQELTD